MNATFAGAERVYLIGYRGAGKSTIGHRLAQALHWEFADTDDEIISASGRTIAELFADPGEPAFRDYETAALQNLSKHQQIVIATGGGIVLRQENRAYLASWGFPIWLRAPAETLFARIQADAGTAHRRPHLIAGGSLHEVETLLRVREPLYATVARLIIDTDKQSPDEVVSRILASC
ncbi:MAG: shikimate kinase [Gemmataceae bacterium]